MHALRCPVRSCAYQLAPLRAIVRAGCPGRLSLGEHLDRAWMQDRGRIEPGSTRESLRTETFSGLAEPKSKPSGPGNYQE